MLNTEIPQIKEMSLVELTSYLANKNKIMECPDLLKECMECGCMEDGIPMVTAFAKGKFHPNPLEAIEYITHLASQNADLMEALVRTIKKKDGGMSGLMGSVMEQPEGLKEIALGLDGEKGSNVANNLCRSLNDLYEDYREQFEGFNESALSPPIGFDGEEDDEDGGGEIADKEEEDEETFRDLDQGEEGEEEDEGLGDLDLGDEEENDWEKEEGPEGDLPELPKPKDKKRKKFGHDNVIDAMGNHSQMMNAMKKRCSAY
jgi:hypothetical protein